MNDNAIGELINSIKEPTKKTANTYMAIVSKVDSEGIVWVNLAGNSKETPTASTSTEIKSGDVVMVEWHDNKLYIAGNYTNPSAGTERVFRVEKTAQTAQDTADDAEDTAQLAQEAATQAQKIAGDTEQHFWFTETGTDTGAHITEIPQEEWNDSTSQNYHSGGNLLARSNGIAIRKGLNELASFGADGAHIGAFGENKVRINSESMTFYDATDTEQFSIQSQGTQITGIKQVGISTGASGYNDMTLAIPSGTSINYRVDSTTSYSGTFTVAVGSIVSNAYVEFRVTYTDETKTIFTLTSFQASNRARAIVIWEATYYEPLIETIGDCHIGGSISIGEKLTVSNLPSGLTTTQENTSTGSISATTDSGDKTATFTNSGYYPIGIVGINVAGTNRMYANLYEYRISSASNGSCTVTYRLRNNASVSVSLTIYFDILWAKI